MRDCRVFQEIVCVLQGSRGPSLEAQGLRANCNLSADSGSWSGATKKDLLDDVRVGTRCKSRDCAFACM